MSMVGRSINNIRRYKRIKTTIYFYFGGWGGFNQLFVKFEITASKCCQSPMSFRQTNFVKQKLACWK